MAKGRIDTDGLDGLIRVLWLGVIAALVALILSNFMSIVAVVGIGALIFLAAFAVGALRGFLFGVPRTLSRDQASPSNTPPGPGSGATGQPNSPVSESASAVSAVGGRSARSIQSNTNLEKISDWLTTLLVGAGLAELYRLNDALIGFHDFLAAGARVFDGGRSAGVLPILGPILLVFGLVCGFLFMYLNTRLVLIMLFDAIERLVSGDDKLDPEGQKIVARAIDAGGGGDFVKTAFESQKGATVQDALSLMFDLLYKEQYEQVIQLGAQLRNTAAAQRADYWFYLAAAFGQKMAAAQKADDSSAAFSAMDNAMDCAARAVAIDASYRDRLWAISTPGGFDDDLAPLRKQERFLRLVGRTLADV